MSTQTKMMWSWLILKFPSQCPSIPTIMFMEPCMPCLTRCLSSVSPIIILQKFILPVFVRIMPASLWTSTETRWANIYLRANIGEPPAAHLAVSPIAGLKNLFLIIKPLSQSRLRSSLKSIALTMLFGIQDATQCGSWININYPNKFFYRMTAEYTISSHERNERKESIWDCSWFQNSIVLPYFTYGGELHHHKLW